MKSFHFSLFYLLFTSKLLAFDIVCPYGCDDVMAKESYYTLSGLVYETSFSDLCIIDYPSDHCWGYSSFTSYNGYCSPSLSIDRRINWILDKSDRYISFDSQKGGYTKWIGDSNDTDIDLRNIADYMRGFSILNHELEKYVHNEIACYKKGIDWTKLAIAYFEKLQQNGAYRCCADWWEVAEKPEDKVKEGVRRLEEYEKKLQEVHQRASYLREQFEKRNEANLENYADLYQWCLEKHQWNGAYYGMGLLNFHRGEIAEAFDNIQSFLNGLKDEEKKQLSKEVCFQRGVIESEVGLYDDAIISLSRAIEKDPTYKEAHFERAVAYFESGEFDLALKDYLASEMRPLKDEKNVSFSADYASGFLEGIKKGFQEEFGDSLPVWAPMLGAGLWSLSQSPLPQAKIVTGVLACVGAAGAYLAANQVVSELRELVANWDQLSDQQRGKLTGYIIGKHGIEVFAIAGSAKLMKSYQDLKRANQMLTFEMMLIEEAQVASIKTRYKKVEKLRKDKENIKKYFGKNSYEEQEIRDNLQKMGYQIPSRPAGIPENFITKYAEGVGICYHDPVNPKHEYVRLMPGNPQSPNPAQQGPYIVHYRNGKSLRIEGDFTNTKDPSTHIPPEKYKYIPPNKAK